MVAKVAEQDLWASFHTTRDPKLREQLVMQSVPLVHYLLRHIGITPAAKSDYEDLVHQGLIGLIDAVDHFDPAYGTRFSTYACSRIRGKILDYMRASDWMPRSARKRVREIQRTVANLWTELQREPSDAEVAERMGINLEVVQQAMVDASRVLVSLDAEFDMNEDQDGGLLDVLADEAQVPPSEQQGEHEMLDRLAQAIESLEERQRLVLSLYYYEELTLKEIGVVLGVSESRVCQLHARAVMNLKVAMKDE